MQLKSPGEGRLTALLLDRFLADQPAHLREEAHRTALLGHLHAVTTVYQSLGSHLGGNLLEAQAQLAQTVVSKGGLNNQALEFLRSSEFGTLVGGASGFMPSPDWPTTRVEGSGVPQTLAAPANFFPCIVGSGRLAAAFIVGLERLGVPRANITIFSRSALKPSSPLMIWYPILANQPMEPQAFHRLDFQAKTLDHKPDAVFLLLKKTAFEKSHLRHWLNDFIRDNGNPMVVNLMAGGTLMEGNDREMVVRANVLVSRPSGGNLLCYHPQLDHLSGDVGSMLTALGQLLPVNNKSLLARLTFFTSTLSLVFMNEIDNVLFADLPTGQANRAMLANWSRRYQLARYLLENHATTAGEALSEPLNPVLEDIALRYMAIYLGLA